MFTTKLKLDPNLMALVILTDADLVSVTQVCVFGVNAVDQHSIAAAQINDPIAILFATDLKVPARDRLKHLRHGDIVTVPAASNSGHLTQSERFLPAVGPVNYDLGVFEI
jgi:hypothetical protein